MVTYKCIATLCWKFDTDLSSDKSLQMAKDQLEAILDCHPKGDDFEDFTIQVDLAKMKDRQRLIHLGEFQLEDVFSFITEDESKRDYIIDGVAYSVKMNSKRYFVFQKNQNCVACGLKGTRMVLDLNPGDQSPHFNLYGEEDGRLVLMTKDHILAKSRGGSDELSNFQTCCSTCNNLKGAYDLTVSNVRELRRLWDNEDKLPRKELRKIINKTRDQMAVRN